MPNRRGVFGAHYTTKPNQEEATPSESITPPPSLCIAPIVFVVCTPCMDVVRRSSCSLHMLGWQWTIGRELLRRLEFWQHTLLSTIALLCQTTAQNPSSR